MALKPEEISLIIKEQIQSYGQEITKKNVGSVISVGDGIATIYGLSDAMANELIQFDDPHNTVGMVLNLEEDLVGAVLFGEGREIKEGTKVTTTGKIASVPVGDALIGRVVDPLGRPLDNKGPIHTIKTRPVEHQAAGIIDRKSVHQPMQTGIMAIDAMIPIGRGQRELIIGDRQTGKTTIAIDTILNQKNLKDRPICIYVAIGQRQGAVAQIVKLLEEQGAMDYTTVVIASSTDAPALQFISPFSGVAIGEEFMYQGKDVLIVYDDLSKHAWAYRSMSLLLRRPPGREAYPGDVFYLHSRLLERASKLSDELGAGSITALPIVETQAGDVSAYIPTNVISITDGQIFLESDLFNSGIRPAINVGISVSRVGGAAQTKAIKQVAGPLRLDLAQYRELKGFAQFASDLDRSAQLQLIRGERLTWLLTQPENSPLELAAQVTLLYSGIHGLIDNLDKKEVEIFKKRWLAEIRAIVPDLYKSLNEGKAMSDEDKTILKQELGRLVESISSAKKAA
ncbi:MAG: F0F1 ATP synthase subunit alpha [Candidatus Caenarcaniphilales bacterium]|nr:F0F1 ATP synthase subunit alpha [Candidatus Caenarcaniphilales bacterium]